MSEQEYPQMEGRPGLFLEDTTVYMCNNCERYVAIPDDQARPSACPYGCKHE